MIVAKGQHFNVEVADWAVGLVDGAMLNAAQIMLWEAERNAEARLRNLYMYGTTHPELWECE